MKMTPRKRKNKLNQKTLESLKEPGMYFFNDAPAIAVKVTKNQRKSFYASYSISKGVDSEGRIRSTGRYKFICRLGEKPISVVRETVINNIKKWKAETTTGKGDDVAASSFLSWVGGNFFSTSVFIFAPILAIMFC